MGTYSKTTTRKPWQQKEAMAKKILNGVGSQKRSSGVLELSTESWNVAFLPRALQLMWVIALRIDVTGPRKKKKC